MKCRARCAGLLGLAVALVAVLLALAPAGAFASQTRLYTGISFGPDGVSGTESFLRPSSVAVDQASGDVYVYDAYGETKRIYKFDAAGEPLDFSSTSTNAIDVDAGVYEAFAAFQLAIAPPGAPGGTAGDIFLASAPAPGVQVYAPSGEKLGEFGPKYSCGVTTDQSGNVFVSTNYESQAAPGVINEYEPTANPPLDEDLVGTGASNPAIGGCNVATDGAGHFYVGSLFGTGIYELEGIGDETPTKIDTGGTLAVDPGTGALLADRGDRVAEYAPGGAKLLGTFGANQLRESQGVAINAAADQAYVADSGGVSGAPKVKIFGGLVPVPTVVPGDARTPLPSEAVLPGTVNPEGLAVTECFFEYGKTESYGSTAECEALPPTNSDPDPVTATVTGLEPDGVTYHFRLVAANANGSESTQDQTFTTAPTVVTEPAAPVGERTATLRGKVFPDGLQYSECEFEYGLTSEPGFPESAECVPAAGAIAPDLAFHAVTAELTGLEANDATYRFRLKATNANGTVTGKALTFTTSGEPQLDEVRAVDADKDSATLEASIDPHGFQTSYRIEWGPTAAYGRTAARGSLGPDAGPTRIKAPITNLSAGTRYHFRVVASNQVDTVTSLDREVEALDRCGLPQGRCFELVSPHDVGPIAAPGKSAVLFELEMQFQAAATPGALAYVSEGGVPGATRGAEVLYKGERGPGGWSSSQLSPSITARDETNRPMSESSRMLGVSPDLDCGVVESASPLTTDPGTRAVFEAGGLNLYRIDADGTYTALTRVPPENVEAEGESFGIYFRLAGASADCSKVFFTSVYHFPGTGAVGKRPLYEWDEGTLRSVGFVPGPTGEVPVEAAVGGGWVDPFNTRNDLNAVSADGSRIFFSAERQVGNNPGEVGQTGVFVREDGVKSRDLSLSETLVADDGATYQYATPDGSRVYFTANAGLTDESSPEGTDLYEYDLEKAPAEHPLRDLSVAQRQGPEPAAEVAGMLGASDDGSRVYFAAFGRLIAGKGLSAEENRQEGTYSLYALASGRLTFVATVKAEEGLLTTNAVRWTSRVSPDGRYLLFESTRPVTSYRSGGAREAYLYDAAAASEPIACISCRPDGRPSAAAPIPGHPAFSPAYRPLVAAGDSNPAEPLVVPQSLVVSDGQPSVMFSSLDPLAPGAVEGTSGLYEWSHGQVFLIAAEPAELVSPSRTTQKEDYLRPFGASADGADVYFATPQSLTWEDGDERFSVYDARVGGGFPQPSAPAAPCRPATEGSCQGPASSPAAIAGPTSSSFTGPGNPKPKHCKKHHVIRHGKCVKARRHKRHTRHGHKRRHGKRHHGKRGKKHNGNGHHGKGHKKRADGNRRAGK